MLATPASPWTSRLAPAGPDEAQMTGQSASIATATIAMRLPAAKKSR